MPTTAAPIEFGINLTFSNKFQACKKVIVNGKTKYIFRSFATLDEARKFRDSKT